MSVPLLEGTSGTSVGDSTSPSQQFSSTDAATSPGSTSAGEHAARRDLLTIHVGNDVTLAQEDLELLLVVVQTLLLAAWAYKEVF